MRKNYRKTYRKTHSKKPKSKQTFGSRRKLPYTKNGCMYPWGSFPIVALMSAATYLLDPAFLKKLF